TIPLFRNERRFFVPLKTLPFSFIAISFYQSSFEAIQVGLPSVRMGRAIPDGYRLTQRKAERLRNCVSRFETGLRGFSATGIKTGRSTTLTGLSEALFRFQSAVTCHVFVSKNSSISIDDRDAPPPHRHY